MNRLQQLHITSGGDYGGGITTSSIGRSCNIYTGGKTEYVSNPVIFHKYEGGRTWL